MILEFAQGTKEWLDMRRMKITSTDASIIMGHNKFGGNSPYKLWQLKMGLIDPPKVNAKMREGSELENVALGIFKSQWIKDFDINNKPVWQSDEYDWMIASLDCDINEDEYIEVKCGEAAYKEAEFANIPEYIYDQIQHTLMTTSKSWCHLVHYRLGKDIIHMPVKANVDYQQKLLKEELKFLKCMKECIAPEDKSIEMVEDLEATGLAMAYEVHYKERKAIEEEMEKIGEKLKKYAKDKSVKFGSTGVSVIKVSSSLTTDWRSVQKAYTITNEDLKKYKKEKSGYYKVEVRRKQ